MHALGQVAHADFRKKYPFKMLHDGLNFYLRDYRCRVQRVEAADPEFHARFSAKTKTYVYRVIYSRTNSIFDEKRAWWISNKIEIDLSKAIKESQYLVGHHDFSSFRDSSCQSPSPIKTMEKIEVIHSGDRLDLHFTAKSFLHKQIRITVGTLIDIARGRFDSVTEILGKRDRTYAGQTAPGYGLFLKNVDY